MTSPAAPQRVLFVTASFLPESIGGVELHVLNLARRMAEDRQVMVFCRGADPARPEFDVARDEVDGIPVVRLNYRFSDCTEFRRAYVNPAIRARFAEVLAEFRPDVVHVHHLTCLSTDLLDAARAGGARVVMTLHDFWMGCPRGQRMTPDLELCHDVDVERCADCVPRMWGGWFGAGRDGADVPADELRRRDVAQLREYHRWIRDVLLRTDRLVTPSASSRRIFARQGIAAEHVTVVENGLDHAPFRGLPRRPRGRPFRFGFIGTVLPTKGVHVLIEAFRRLAAEDAVLDVHGELLPWHEVTDYPAQLRAQAAPLGERVVFHGRYEAAELPARLATLDALVVPSLWFEAFCLTLREGFLAGVPVLASRLGAMEEAIEDGVTGLLFEPGDAGDLARAMARVLTDEPLRQRLVAATKHVRTIEDNVRDLLAVYRGEPVGPA